MWARRAARALLVAGATITVLGMAGGALAGPSDLEQISPLVWTILAISVGGAVLTFSVLAYAIWKFRDPETKGRRYG